MDFDNKYLIDYLNTKPDIELINQLKYVVYSIPCYDIISFSNTYRLYSSNCLPNLISIKKIEYVGNNYNVVNY